MGDSEWTFLESRIAAGKERACLAYHRVRGQKEVFQLAGTDSRAYGVLYLASKLRGPHPFDDVPLVGNDVGLPQDCPKHQAHYQGGQAQRQPQLRVAGFRIQATNHSGHGSLLACAGMDGSPSGSRSQVGTLE